MGNVVQIKPKASKQLDVQWEKIEQILASNESTVAIKITDKGSITVYQSDDVDHFTLVGLLELFKSKLAV